MSQGNIVVTPASATLVMSSGTPIVNSGRVITYLKEHPTELEELTKKPEKLNDILAKLGDNPAYWYDRWIYRMVVIFLGIVILAGALGAIVLVILDKTIPEILVALGSAAIGGLVGLFSGTRKNNN
jgi:hypothetical protein